MKEFTYVITDEEGIHARPAGELVKAVKEFGSDITITANGKTMSCRKLLGIMSLGVKKGQEVTLRFAGEDEETACEAIGRFMQENL